MGKEIQHWKCNTCGDTEGVQNGVCPTCGPTQTTPLSDEAKEEAGIVEEKKDEEVESTPEE